MKLIDYMTCTYTLKRVHVRKKKKKKKRQEWWYRQADL